MSVRDKARGKWPVEEALEGIRRESGRQFDPALVELFLGLGFAADGPTAGAPRRTVAV